MLTDNRPRAHNTFLCILLFYTFFQVFKMQIRRVRELQLLPVYIKQKMPSAITFTDNLVFFGCLMCLSEECGRSQSTWKEPRRRTCDLRTVCQWKNAECWWPFLKSDCATGVLFGKFEETKIPLKGQRHMMQRKQLKVVRCYCLTKESEKVNQIKTF